VKEWADAVALEVTVRAANSSAWFALRDVSFFGGEGEVMGIDLPERRPANQPCSKSSAERCTPTRGVSRISAGLHHDETTFVARRDVSHVPRFVCLNMEAPEHQALRRLQCVAAWRDVRRTWRILAQLRL